MNKIDNLFYTLVKDVIQENVTDYPRKELAKDVWDKNRKMKPSVKKEIMSIFEKWQRKVFPEAKIKNIYVLGSITTFQYNKTSDIDVNFILYNKKEEINKVWKLCPNGNTIGDHPVNYYLSFDTHDVDLSKTLYDLERDTWVREPSEKNNKIPENYSIEIAKFFMDGIDLRLSEYNRDKKELDRLQELLDDGSSYDEEEVKEDIARKEQEILADKDAIRLAYHLVKSLRWEGFKDEKEKNDFDFTLKIENKNETRDPNTSLNNLVYKNLEKYGYFDKIKDIVK